MINYRENNIWSVYIHISPSDKYYVGITSQNPISARWRNGKGYRNNLHFWRNTDGIILNMKYLQNI